MLPELNKELFELLNSKSMYGAKSPVFGRLGLMASELDSIEDQLGLNLPTDMRFLLENLDDSENLNFSWKNFALEKYENSIEWVVSGIEFDIENNGTWLNRWGDRPNDLSEAKGILREDFKSWPRLVPVFGHRFLVVDPCSPNNPVFSIMQTDIICYGANLGAYLKNDFFEKSDDAKDWTPTKVVPIWNDFVVRTEGFLKEG